MAHSEQVTGAPAQTAELLLSIAGTTRRFQLALRDVCRIGRTPDNDIQIPAENVSRNHALVQGNGASLFVLFDLGSRNGTYVNGSRVAVSVPLRNGDVISISGQELRFVQLRGREERDSATGCADETRVERPVSEITVLVADIRGYTRLCQQLGETRVAEMMQTLNAEAGAVLAALQAWGVKYMGDAVMAIWVNDGPTERFLVRALRALSGLFETAQSLQARFELESPVQLGAAVNVGMASIGNMGSNALPDYTALGDAVNKVFRLQDAARKLHADVVMSNAVYLTLRRQIDPENSMTPCPLELRDYAKTELVYPMDQRDLRRALQRAGVAGKV